MKLINGKVQFGLMTILEHELYNIFIYKTTWVIKISLHHGKIKVSCLLMGSGVGESSSVLAGVITFGVWCLMVAGCSCPGGYTLESRSVSASQRKTAGSAVTQTCQTPCDPMDHSPPGSSVHRILQARTLKWVATSYCRRSSQSRDWTHVSHITSRLLTIWATREAL